MELSQAALQTVPGETDANVRGKHISMILISIGYSLTDNGIGMREHVGITKVQT